MTASKRQWSDQSLAGRRISVHLGEQVQTYTFVSIAGSGQKAVTWKALDHFDKPHAIKIVQKSDYGNHSIEAEIKQTMDLGPRFAQIRFYGEPSPADPDAAPLPANVFAVVVEWVDGETLQDFCQNHGASLDVGQFLELARTMCEALALLEATGLCHNDLHARNIMIARERTGPTLTEDNFVRVIDTGSLTSVARKMDLLRAWTQEIQNIESLGVTNAATVVSRLTQLKNWLTWRQHTDQEWVVQHLCTLVSELRKIEHRLPSPQRAFLADVVPVLSRMVDPDHSMRVDKASDMYWELEHLWKTVSAPPPTGLSSPFDFISAELIRSDKKLSDLFSYECPWFKQCSTTDPVYIYGPRGCGKSTVLRMLALSAVFAAGRGEDWFDKGAYIGVYLSCSSELRSRFWLFPEDQYARIQADAVLFFNMLLVDSLLGTLELLRDGEVEQHLGHSVGLTNEAAREISSRVFARFGMPEASPKIRGVSWLAYARNRLAIERDSVWLRILTNPVERIPDPSLIFDLVKDLEHVFPLLRQKHIAFLLDDYSNQRIPPELQRILNQSISFAKQGNPIFKVSSEYQGVDLDGIQEGREVVEVNLGKEYVDLTDRSRSAFLEDVLGIRFREANEPVGILDVLGKSGIMPSVGMARLIRAASEPDGAPFYYHGIDTIADICSGDLAMALDLVKQIYYSADSGGSQRQRIPERRQHELIRRYSDREHMYLRYYAPFGKEMSDIVDALCWLAHEAAVRCNSVKDGVAEPMVKTHLDLSLPALGLLSAEKQRLLGEMQKRGILFSLDTSRSRIENQATERYQVRRILLVKHLTPLGRRDPIKLDTDQSILFLLTEPREFARKEIEKNRRADLGKSQTEELSQMRMGL